MTFLGEKITHIYYTKPAKTYSGQTDPLILHWWRDLGPQIDSASIIVDSQVVTLQTLYICLAYNSKAYVNINRAEEILYVLLPITLLRW